MHDANLQRELRNQHARILRQINHCLHELTCQRADQLAREIALTDDSHVQCSRRFKPESHLSCCASYKRK